MYPKEWKTLFLCGAVFLLGLGCQPVETKPSDTNSNKEDKIVPSQKANLRFKGGLRLVNHLSKALSWPKDKLCKELGRYDCARDAHRITLGGVEPYRLNIRSAWKAPPAIAPIAVDRLMLSACEQRAKADFADAGKALLYKPIVGKQEADPGAMKEVVSTLYKRLLIRLPTPKEVSHFVGFWEKVKANKNTKNKMQAWATLTCFGITSSLEFLFY